MIKVNYISLPKGLPSAVVKDNRMVKAVTIFYQLKSLYVGGIIHDYTKKCVDIATTFEYSDRKLRTYIRILKEEGLASVDKNKSLVLASSKKLALKYGASDKFYYKITSDKLVILESVIKALAIEENLGKQDHITRKKVLDSAIRSVGITNPTSLSATAYRKYKRLFSKQYDALLAKIQKRYIQAISNLQNPDKELLPYITLTRQGIATCLGFKSKATGVRYAKLLKSMGFLTETTNVVQVQDSTYEEYLQLLDSTDHDYTYKFVQGVIYKVLPNNISIKSSSFLL